MRTKKGFRCAILGNNLSPNGGAKWLRFPLITRTPRFSGPLWSVLRFEFRQPHSLALVALVCWSSASGQTYNFTTIAGLAGWGGSADGVGSAARFTRPEGVAADSAGHVYVADAGNSTIRQLTLVGSNWVSSTIAGLAGSTGGADGTNSDARFNHPTGLALDSTGNMYVADSANYTIRKLAHIGADWVSSTIAGLAGSRGSADGTNSDARFYSPSGPALDSTGSIYVADEFNSTIRKVTPVGTNWVSSTIAGLAGSYGFADGTNSNARFSIPDSVAVDAVGNVYVGDYGVGIRKIAPLGTNWITSTIPGLYDPQGVAVDAAGNIYVTGYDNTIVQLSPAGTNWVTRVLGGLGESLYYGGADGAGCAARFNSPSGITLDGAGNLYVADAYNNTIREGTPSVNLPLAGAACACAAITTGFTGGFAGQKTSGMNYGTVFRVNTNGSFATLFQFGFTNGANPSGALLQANDGNVYGTTVNGGSNNCGTIFQMTTNGVVGWSYSLSLATGRNPYGALMQGQDGNLYGTTEWGGANDRGTVFRISPTGSAFSNLYSFYSSTDTFAAFPYAGVVQGSDGYLYGTTQFGGTNGSGTVFKMTTNGAVVWTFSFNDTDGYEPDGGVTFASDGNLYGTTDFGGTNGDYGTVFKITTSGAETTLVSSDPSAPIAFADPVAPLIVGRDGALYSTSQWGGTNGAWGTVIKVATNGMLTVLASFNYMNGARPKSGLVPTQDGSLYGVAPGGVNDAGTIFRMTSNGVLSSLHAFAIAKDGYAPVAWFDDPNDTVMSLMLAADGSLYGTTPYGIISTNASSDWVLNGGASISNDVLVLTDNGLVESRSAFCGSRQYTWDFSASFTYQAAGNLAGRGFAFVIQNDPAQASALGDFAAGLGYGTIGFGHPAISPSAALEFNLYNPDTVGISFQTNGQTGGYLSTAPVNLASGDPISVTMKYSPVGPGIFWVQLTDLLTGDSYSNLWNTAAWNTGSVDDPPTNFVGFTSGTGIRAPSSQTIKNFSINWTYVWQGDGYNPPTGSPTQYSNSGYWTSGNPVWAFRNFRAGSFYMEGDPVEFWNPRAVVVNGNLVGPTNVPVFLTNTVTPSSVWFRGGSSYLLTGNGGIGGPCGMIVDGGTINGVSTTVSLSTANTYCGVTTINGGLMVLGNANAVQNSIVSLAGGALGFSGGIGAFTLGGLAGNGRIALTDSGSNPVTLVVGNNNSSTTCGGLLTGSGGLTKIGSGTLTLLGNNAYTGPTTISAGTLAASATSLGLGPVAIAPGATLALLSGFNQDLIAEATNSTSAGTTAGFDGTYALYEAGFPGSPAGTGLPSSGLITNGSTGVQFQLQPFTRNNALQLSPATGSGPTSGTLALVAPGHFNTISVLGAAANGSSTFYMTLNFADGSATIVATNTLSDWFDATPYAISNLGRATRTIASPTFSGAPGNPRLYELDYTLSSADQSKVLSSITFTDLGDELRQGSARLNTFAVSCGVGPFTANIGSLAGGGNVLLNGNTLAIGNTNNLSSTFSGVIGDGNGRGNLLKAGTGRLTLTGTNTYRGGTTVSGGTLIVNGALADTDLTVQPSGGFGGVGTLGGSVTVNSAALIFSGMDSNSIGTLTISNNLILQGTALIKIDPGVGKSDLISAGTVTYGGTLSVSNLSGAVLSAGNVFRVFAATNYSGNFVSVTPILPGPALRWDTSGLAVNGTLGIVSVPRPAITGVTLSGTKLTMNAVNGLSGSTYYVLTTTNLAVPLHQWASIATNILATSGNFILSVTNAVSPTASQQFFTLQVE